MSAFITLRELSVGDQSANYPKSLTDMYEVREFIGRSGKVPSDDIRVGHVTLKPGADYPGHTHPAPEVYVQISGKVEWTVGGEKQVVETLTAIGITPDTVHAMRNLGEENAELIYFWYTPKGDADVLSEEAKLVDSGS